MLAYFEKIDNLFLLILLLTSLDLVFLPFWVKNFSFHNLLLVWKSERTLKRYYKYMAPMVFLTFLMSLFINMDKVLIAQAGYIEELEIYGYLFLYVFAIHRFFTTPFVMRYSSIYYRSTEDKINDSVIIKGVLLIVSGALSLAAFFYFFQSNKFNLGYLSAFTLFVISLYFLNMQMLYLKKKLQINVLLVVFIKVMIFSLIIWSSYLLYFGANSLEVVVVVNSVVALAFLFKVARSLDLLYFYLFSFVSIWFVWVSL